MRVPDNLKLNKFRDVAIPRNEEYFGRTGLMQVGESMYTGDDVAPLPQNKLDSLALMDEYEKNLPIPDDEK